MAGLVRWTGGDSVMDKVEIRWPTANAETLTNVAADAIYTLVEGRGITTTVKCPPPAAR
jgi:ASPIC/UnbV protein